MRAGWIQEMQLLFILFICLACMPLEDRAIPAADWQESLVGTLLGIILVALAAELPARWLTARLRRDPSRRPRIVRWYNRWRMIYLALSISVYAVTRLGFNWGHLVRTNWDLANTILLGDVLVLAPLLITLVLSWLSFYRVELALHDTSAAHPGAPFWTGREYLSFYSRHYLGLVFAVLILLVGIPETLQLLMPDAHTEPWFPLASLFIYMGGAVVLMPWLLTVVWSTRSLPAGPLRDRLEAAAKKLHFRFTDIRLWNTYGGLANAMVTGLLRHPRYIFLSDHLIDNLTPQQVEAVFGHEVGHVKHLHLQLYLAFFVLSTTLIGFLTADFQVAGWEGFTRPAFLSALLATGGVGFGYFWLVFGFLSRRCERQADIHGCKAVSPDGCCLTPDGIRTFITALERVAELNGIRKDRPSWLHSSIARRVAFLEKLLERPTDEPRFQRRLAVIKWLLFLGLLSVTLLCGQYYGWSRLWQ